MGNQVVYNYFVIDPELNTSIKCSFKDSYTVIPTSITPVPGTDHGYTLEDAYRICEFWANSDEHEVGYDYEVDATGLITETTKVDPIVNSVRIEEFLAQKVAFKKVIDEDSFIERGMIAWLTCIAWDDKVECYDLFFDFSEFESRNEKYMRKVFYKGDDLVTAREAGEYKSKFSVFFSISSDKRDDALFNKEIQEYLHLIEVDTM